MRRRVVVTGMGLLTPLGNSLESFWQNSIEGKIGYDKLEGFDKMKLKSRVAGRIPEFELLGNTAVAGKREQMGRPGILAVNAAIRAVEDSGIDFELVDRERSAVCIANAIADTPFSESAFLKMTDETGKFIANGTGLPLYRKGMFSFIAFDVAHQFGLKGQSFVMSTGCTGGIDAIGCAYQSIMDDEHDVMICGASEAPVTYMTIASFDAVGALTSHYNDYPKKASRPFDLKRSGFVLSEGCAVIVLEEQEHAVHRGAKIYGEIVSFASTCNAYHMTDLPEDGEALSAAMNLAISDASLEPGSIDYINAHGSSTLQNDLFETAAYKKTFGDLAYCIPISSTKSMVGHPLSAASAIEIVHCFLALNQGCVPPTVNLDYPDPVCDLNYVPNKALKKDLSVVLTNASGFSGIHSVMIISKNEFCNAEKYK